MGEVFEKHDIPWNNDVFSTPSTSIPEVIEEESKHVGIVVICVISAILAIALLFVIAVFIDCRQQKLRNEKSTHVEKRLRIRLPISLFGRSVSEDEDTIVDKLESWEPSVSNNVIV